MSELLNIEIDAIRENPVALRNVNRENENYLGLIDSIRAVGVMNAVNVRRKTDPDTGDIFFELVDGLHRFSAARDAGLETIPAQVLNVNDAEALEAQIIGNIHRIETKPVEYSQQLRRILAANPMMTEAELAVKLGKSPSWISSRLGLNKIENEKIKALIDEGNIPLSNAYSLAKLPEDEQIDFLESAQTETPDVFVGKVNQRVKEMREAARQGRDPKAKEFTATAYMQKLSAVKEALDDPSIANALIEEAGVATVTEAFQLALQWCLHLDPVSVAAAKAKWDADQQAKEEARQRRAQERAQKKAEAARLAAEEAAAATEGSEA